MRTSFHRAGWLLFAVLFFGIQGSGAEEPSVQLGVESAPSFSADAPRVIVTLVVKNTGEAPFIPNEVFNNSQIIINGRSFPVYMTRRSVSESVIQPGETFSQTLDLKFYEPFREIARYTVTWKY